MDIAAVNSEANDDVFGMHEQSPHHMDMFHNNLFLSFEFKLTDENCTRSLRHITKSSLIVEHFYKISSNNLTSTQTRKKHVYDRWRGLF